MSRRIALVVGINQYAPQTQLKELSAPVKDAQAIYDVLRQYGHFDTVFPLPLANGQVGESGIVSAMELEQKLSEVFSSQSANPDDLIVFYFSGHAVSQKGQIVWLASSDERYAIAFKTLSDWAKKSGVNNVCLWLDCCHSGEILEYTDLDNSEFCIIAASHATGEALAPHNEHSLMTAALLEALTPDNINQPEIRVLDLIRRIEAKRKNLPQQILTYHGKSSFTLTRLDGNIPVDSRYPEDYPPYKGLLVFEGDDKDFFFGRTGMVQELLDALNQGQFIPMLGASGSGKSSLVLAGLLPELDETDWVVLTMRPTAEPLQRLRDAFRDKRVQQSGDSEIQVSVDDVEAVLYEVEQLTAEGQRLLLVIDQFEEVFTGIDAQDEAKRAAFIHCLLDAVQHSPAFHVLITLRTDFIGACDDYPLLREQLQPYYAVGNLDAAGLREAISEPLKLVGMRCEQTLEDELVTQTLQKKGSLPLLQFVLEKLWQLAREECSRKLTLAMYQQLGGEHGGGLRRVLNEKADAFYQGLDAEQQRLMEWLMMELTHVGDEDTAQVVALAELYERQPDYQEALDGLIALVTKERLLVSDQREDGEATVAVAHEALIRDWGRVAEWLESNREIRHWRSRVAADIEDWKVTGGSLLRDGRLAEAEELVERYSDSLLIGNQVIHFIQTSSEINTIEEQKQEQKFKELLVVNLISQARLAMTNQSQNVYIDQALLLIVKAFQIDSSSELTKMALRDILQLIGALHKVGYGKEINALAVSPDGKYLVSGGDYGLLQQWCTDGLTPIDQPWVGHKQAWISIVSISPDNNFMATYGHDGSILLWNMNTKSVVCELWSHEDLKIEILAFSPDSKYISSADDNGYIRIWSTISQKSVASPWRCDEQLTSIYALSFSPDNKKIFCASRDILGMGCVVSSWYSETGKSASKAKKVCKDRIAIAAFSRDCKLLAIATENNTIQLIHLTSASITGYPIAGPFIHGYEGEASLTSFSQDGQHIACATGIVLRKYDIHGGLSFDNRLWQGHSQQVSSLIFDDQNNLAFTGSRDGSIRAWETKRKQPLITSSWHCDGCISAITFLTDKKRALLAVENKLHLFDLSSGKSIGKPWSGHADNIYSLALNANGNQVVSTSYDDTIRLWSVVSGEPIGSPWKCSNVITAIFSPDESEIISATFDGKIHVWDSLTGNLISKSENNFYASTIVFSPNGKRMLTVESEHSYSQLWDLTNREPIGDKWHSHYQGTFSPCGRYVISADHGNQALWWRSSTDGKLIGSQWGRPEDDWVECLAFSSDGKLLASAGVESGASHWILNLWDTDPKNWAKKACNIVNRNFSHTEWQRFIGDALPYQKTCPDHPAPGDPDWVEPYTGS